MAQKILIIRFSSIGDIVLTSPVIRCLKLQSDTEIHYLTKAAYAGILEANPYVKKVFSIKKEINEVIKQLKIEQYDYIIDLHKNLRSFRLRLALGQKTSSFDKLNFEKWLICNFKINRLPKVHIVERYLEALHVFNIKNDRQGLDYFIPEMEEKATQTIRNQYPEYLVFAIGAAHATKRLPVELISKICRSAPLPVILIGGKTDKKNADFIVRNAKGTIINQCGEFSIHQSASIIKHARIVVTHDTGMMHIAAAFKKAIISIWGNTIPEFGMYPYLPSGSDHHYSFQVEKLACRPCSKIGYKTCPKKHFKCMKQQDIAAIISKMAQLCTQ